MSNWLDPQGKRVHKEKEVLDPAVAMVKLFYIVSVKRKLARSTVKLSDYLCLAVD